MKYKGIELEPITKVQAFEDGKSMLVWNNNDDDAIMKLVYAITNMTLDPIICEENDYDYCAEIPKPQKREMNSLEVMEYLHLLQLWLDGSITKELATKHFKGFEFPEFEKGLVEFRQCPIILKDNEEKGWCDKAILMEFDDVNTFKFGILKNGEVTEFEIPEIEI